MEGSNSNSSFGSSSTKQLHRRLRGLGQRQWTLNADCELIAHISRCSALEVLDELSNCIVRMAEHIASPQAEEASELLQLTCSARVVFRQLYAALGAALQQLAEGAQQYLQQGQLPAALTVRAVEACNALCLVLCHAQSHSGDLKEQPSHVRRARCQVLHDTGDALDELRVLSVTDHVCS
jgi:hypothetical protein